MTRRAVTIATLALALGACAAPEREELPVAPDGTQVVAAPGFRMPIVVTDGRERVARMRDDIDNLVTLAPLSDDELDVIDALEEALDAFDAGRATATLEELEKRLVALEDVVFARLDDAS